MRYRRSLWRWAIVFTGVLVVGALGVLLSTRRRETSFLDSFHPQESVATVPLPLAGIHRSKHSFLFRPGTANDVLAEMDKHLTAKLGWDRYESDPNGYVIYDKGNAWFAFMSAKVYHNLIWMDDDVLLPVKDGGCVVEYMAEEDSWQDRLRAWIDSL